MLGRLFGNWRFSNRLVNSGACRRQKYSQISNSLRRRALTISLDLGLTCAVWYLWGVTASRETYTTQQVVEWEYNHYSSCTLTTRVHRCDYYLCQGLVDILYEITYIHGSTP